MPNILPFEKHDASVLAIQYASDKRINIKNFFSSDIAHSLSEAVASLDYDYATYIDGIYQTLSERAIQTSSPEQLASLQSKVIHHAQTGTGFWYGQARIDLPNHHEAKRIPPILHKLVETLNSQPMFEFIERVTQQNKLIYTSAQATRYSPGCFLTRHNDVVAREGRCIAYVLGLTEQWHPDWGGLLHFYQQNGAAKDFWVPTFNNLALFDVSHPHSVSFIAPFAKHFRYSITGWFRTIKPAVSD